MYSPIVKKDKSKMKNNMAWSIICGIGWLATLVLVSIELFKDGRDNDWLWGAFISLLATLVIPIELWAVVNVKWLSCFNTDKWYLVIHSFFILSTLSTVIFLGISLSRARVTNHSSQWYYIQAANAAYIISAVAGHEMRPIVRTSDESTVVWKWIKIIHIILAGWILFTFIDNEDGNYKTGEEDWVFTGSFISVLIYFVGAFGLSSQQNVCNKILRIIIVTSSTIALLGTSFLVGLYLDKNFRTTNKLEYSELYMIAFYAVLVSLVCDHFKHRVNKLI